MIFGISMALDVGASITFYHLTTTLTPTSAPLGTYEKEIAQNIADKTQKVKESVQEMYQIFDIQAQQIPTNYVIAEGFALADHISNYVTNHAIDLVIMGTKGETNLSSLVFGSNTSNVIAKTACPVLAIPADYQYKKTTKIAFATNLENIEPELNVFMELVKRMDASLELFYIYPTFPKSIDLQNFDNDTFVENLRKKYAYPKINLHFVHTSNENEEIEGINLFITAYKPAMLIMHTHTRSLLDKFLNPSITEDVATKIHIPLLSFKTS
jgi:nucleotide-binding universal stress UspA family protein